MRKQGPICTPPALSTDGRYTLSEAARLLGLPKSTLYQRLRAMPGFKPTVIGQRLWLFTASDIVKLWEMFQHTYQTG
jgi:Helix-turn-helix domain